MSGIGKGTIVSSIGVILKASGLRVTAIKIDPYLNVDAGTMSPYEHGEVFVLDDGGEVDLDLGNYERFLNVTLTRNHNITTGKIYSKIIENERAGEYLGKTVQVVPHVTDAIQEWIKSVAHQHVNNLEPGGSIREESGMGIPDVTLVEIGGTVGDIEGAAYFEAIRQLSLKLDRHDFCLCFVSFVPYLQGVGELKTKPTQHGVKELRALGLTPDFIFARSEVELNQSTREKLALFTNVHAQNVISMADASNTYHVPDILQSQEFAHKVCSKLKLPYNQPNLTHWTQFAELMTSLHSSGDEVKIAIVGKYTGLKDSYMSLIKSLEHAGVKARRKISLIWIESHLLESKSAEYQEAFEKLTSANGILIPGGFGSRGIEGKIAAANYARENKVPYLGICLGMQIAVIEYCRNMLGLKDANSSEVDPSSSDPVIIDMPELDLLKKGGTMRLGSRPTLVAENSLAFKLYGKTLINERHRHRYEVNPLYVQRIEEAGLKFSGRNETNERMEIMELAQETHPFYIGTQFHPEFLTKPFVPPPVFTGFILASSGQHSPSLLNIRRLSVEG